MSEGNSWQPKHTRLVLLLSVLACIGLAVSLTLMGMSQQVTYFYAPADVLAKQETLLQEQKNIRIGGMVEKGSIHHSPDKKNTITFVVTDMKENLTVHYMGITPDLFREGQGVVAEGKLTGPMIFTATTLLAKHDEKYMPPEVAKALEKNAPKTDKAKP